MPAINLDEFGAEEEEHLIEKKKTVFEMAKSTFAPVSKKWKETSAARDFILYILFVLFFTLVVFNSKPGQVQFELQYLHSRNLGESLQSVDSLDGIYEWLNGPFADTFFPDMNPMGGRLDSSERLAISGKSRVISAARLRVLRAQEVDCKIPNFLKDISGRYVPCSAPYTRASRLKESMYINNSTEDVRMAIEELDFALPFEYRTAMELDTTNSFVQYGTFASYLQDGHALDILPNVAPNQLATYVGECMPNLVASLEACKNDLLADGTLRFGGNYSVNATFDEQSMYDDNFFKVRRAPWDDEESRCPVELDLNGDTCIESEELLVPPEMLPHLHRCNRVPESMGNCRLPYVGFAQMYQLQKPDRCGACKCMCDVDPVCSRSCSAKDIYLDQLEILKYYNWINTTTARAVILDVSMLNPHDNLVTIWRGVIEMPPSGEILSYDKARTVKMFRYVTTHDRIYLGLEIILLVIIGYYILDEGREIFEQRLAYFKDPWNCLDWANIILLIIVTALRISSTFVIGRFKVDSALMPIYVDYPPLAQFAITELNLLAFNFFLFYFKIFKYVYNLPKMGMIVATITTAFMELVIFGIMAFIVLFGFCAAFYVCFGAKVADYRSLTHSMGALFRILIGIFDYFELRDANPSMAPLLFYAYIAIVVFVLLSMFVAIIDDSFAAVKEKELERDISKEFSQLMGTIKGAFSRRKEINALENALRQVDAGAGGDRDGMVDIDELKTVLALVPNALQILNCDSAEDVMERFDDSGDGMLDRSELNGILTMLNEMEEEEEDKTLKLEDKEIEIAEWEKLTMRERMQLSRKGFRPKSKYDLDFHELETNVDIVERNLRDLAETVAKKLSLMLDLMVSLSDSMQSRKSGH